MNEERQKLGLEAKREGEALRLYAKARYLAEQGFGPSELKNYVEWMNYLVTHVIPNNKTFEEYRSRLAEVGVLEQRVSRILAERRIDLPRDYLKGAAFFDEIDRGQRKRKANARKSYAKRKIREMADRPPNLQLLDILFDPF